MSESQITAQALMESIVARINEQINVGPKDADEINVNTGLENALTVIRLECDAHGININN